MFVLANNVDKERLGDILDRFLKQHIVLEKIAMIKVLVQHGYRSIRKLTNTTVDFSWHRSVLTIK